MLPLVLMGLLLNTPNAEAATGYKMPPQEVVDILDAPLTPSLVMSPRHNAFLLVEYDAYPPISLLARPFWRLAGLRIDPALHAEQRVAPYTGLILDRMDGHAPIRVALPDHAHIGLPQWSPDGQRFAFTLDIEDGVQVWVGDAASGKAVPLPDLRVTDILSEPFSWMKDSRQLLVKAVVKGRLQVTPASQLPDGPAIEETSGKVAKVMTFQDLLRNAQDEKAFEQVAGSQLARVDVRTHQVVSIGQPDLYTDAAFSPDGKYLLVSRIKRPFSYRVPYYYFTRDEQVWTADGKKVATVADLPVSDDVPTHGVHTGPRAVHWQPLQPARLVWTEALDGGDPLKKVPYREQLFMWEAPFKGKPKPLMKLQHRFSGLQWTSTPQEALLTETDRDRRWRTTSWLNVTKPDQTRKVVFDLSQQDAYQNPGNPVYETTPQGEHVVQKDGDWIYLAGQGASEKGDRPFLETFNLKTLQKKRLFQSGETSYEAFVAFADPQRRFIVTRHESPTEPPNYVRVDLHGPSRQNLTHYQDPAPQLTGIRKEIVQYTRADGVPLSGTLYLPPGYQPGTRLPLLIWAYPLEYSDAQTAGQVRGSAYRFTRLAGTSPLFFLTQGYAVLDNATMPVVGDPETMNNTFIEQIVASAKAAVEKMVDLGVADRQRILVGGHSYGAFMTANLLAHSDLFAAGIARSGAYNRTLTPFGFQSERRSYWEAIEIYTKVSPFSYAHQIKAPLLLIHGEVDNNPGTYPMQSERMFQAIKGNGGTARLVMLPFESHGYRARESVLHVLAEMFEWADRHVKHRSGS